MTLSFENVDGPGLLGLLAWQPFFIFQPPIY